MPVEPTDGFRGVLAVGGYFGGEVLDAAGAAALAQDVTVQRVAPPALLLGRQQQAALLDGHTDTHTHTHTVNSFPLMNPLQPSLPYHQV